MKSIWETGLDLFRNEILLNPEIKEITVRGILDLIAKDRAGEYFPSQLSTSLIRMFQDLDIYFSVIEPLVIQETVEFFKAYSLKVIIPLVNEGNSSEWAAYLLDFFAKIKAETDRTDISSGYLNIATRKKLIAVVDKEMGALHVVQIVQKGFHKLIKDGRNEDLLNMYLMCQRVNSLDILKKNFAEYIKVFSPLTYQKETGESFIMDPSQDHQMVKMVISLKLQMDTIVSKSFDGAVSFSNTVKESFESFINKRANKPAEMIAKHIDGLLRTVKGITEEEMEKSLEQSLTLFRFIQGKDIFEAFYKKDLAKRLLLSRSSSIDAEKSMLSKLKGGMALLSFHFIECGSAFTMKLEGMFKDMELSKDIIATFKQNPRYLEKLDSLDLYVFVLTDGYWPDYSNIPIHIPENILKIQNVFKDYYLGTHSGRKLTWLSSLSQCIIRADFPKVFIMIHL